MRDLMRRRLAQGQCCRCTKPRVTKWHCAEHREAANQNARQTADRRRNRRASQGKCVDCEQPRKPGNTRCEKHLEEARAAARERCGECGGSGVLVNDGPRSICGDCEGSGKKVNA